MGVVTHGAREGPAGVHTGQIQGPGELAFERRPAVGDRVALEKSWRSFDLISGFTDLDRRAQQRRRLGRGLALDLVLGLRRRQVPVDRRCAHRQQFGTHLRAVTVTAEDELAVTLQPVELKGYRSRQILATLATGGGPNLLQHFESVVGVLRCSRLARPCRDTAARTRRPLGRCREPATSVITRPAGHLDHLIQNLPLVLLRSLHIRLGVPGGDLGARRHRQPTFHASRRSPFRGHSYVRHRGCFAGTFRESSRLLSMHVETAYHSHRDPLELLKHL